MFKSYIIGIMVSVIGGLILTLGVYGFAFYISLLGIASFLVAIIVLISLYRKTSDWKIALKFLSFGYVAALTAWLTFNFLELRNKRKGDTVISAIYVYRQKAGKFPSHKQELPQTVASIRGNYVPDSALTSFKFYFRDLYGIPKIFTSKDSVWLR